MTTNKTLRDKVRDVVLSTLVHSETRQYDEWKLSKRYLEHIQKANKESVDQATTDILKAVRAKISGIVGNDSYAITFQSMSQYRKAIIDQLNKELGGGE